MPESAALPEPAQTVDAPAAEKPPAMCAAAMDLPAPAMAGQAFWPGNAALASANIHSALLPDFRVAAARAERPSEVSEPVVHFEMPEVAARPVFADVASAPAAALPEFALAGSGKRRGRIAEPRNLEANADAGNLAAAGHPAPVFASAAGAALPAFALAPAEPPFDDFSEPELVEPPAMCGICVAIPEASAVECAVEQVTQTVWQWPPARVDYPAMPTAAYKPATPVLALHQRFALVPGAEAVELPIAAQARLEMPEVRIEMRLPAGIEQALAGTTVPLARTAAHPEPRPAQPSAVAAACMEPAAFRVSNIALPEPALAANGEASVFMAPPCAFPAVAAESIPLIEPTVQPLLSTFALHYPAFRFSEQEPAAMMADVKEARLDAAAPAAASVSPAPLAPVSGIALGSPRHDFAALLDAAVPQAPFLTLEFYCKRVNSAATLSLAWKVPVPALRQPRFLLTAIPEDLEEHRAAAAAPPKTKKKAPAEVFDIQEGRKAWSWVRDIAKPLAACFLVGAFLWATVKTMHVGTQTAAVNRDVATIIDAERSTPSSDASGNGSAGAGQPGADGAGFVSGIRHAIASRAATQLTESFREGMAAWSDGRKAASPGGWARTAEGYVRPASFALFRPSADYRDYRVEFFGQIEQKSLSWAVRAHDPKNYYAMKMKVVEPGLRPVVAIEHYPVVEGHKGHRTQTPLPGLILHNNTPYRVEVAVRGNRVTTSVEGQEVDSWTDDLLPKGGVGFFADAGERARVYWVKVAKNEDFLGRICAYISGGGGSSATAELMPGSGAPSQPGSGGWPAERADIAVASIFALRGSQQRRRSEPWSL